MDDGDGQGSWGQIEITNTPVMFEMSAVETYRVNGDHPDVARSIASRKGGRKPAWNQPSKQLKQSSGQHNRDITTTADASTRTTGVMKFHLVQLEIDGKLSAGLDRGTPTWELFHPE